jgi:hypothetical protein
VADIGGWGRNGWHLGAERVFQLDDLSMNLNSENKCTDIHNSVIHPNKYQFTIGGRWGCSLEPIGSSCAHLQSGFSLIKPANANAAKAIAVPYQKATCKAFSYDCMTMSLVANGS